MKTLATLVALVATTLTLAGHAKQAGHYKQLGPNQYLIVLQPGAKLPQALSDFQRAAHVASGFVTGVGVTRNTVLGFYKFNADGTPGKTHTDDTVAEPREVTSLNCVLTTEVRDHGKSADAPPHCHISLAGKSGTPKPTGEGWPVVGGHLIDAEVAVTAELIVTTTPTPVVKVPSSEFGGILIDATDGEPL